jgi:hypothetical protein
LRDLEKTVFSLAPVCFVPTFSYFTCAYHDFLPGCENQ